MRPHITPTIATEAKRKEVPHVHSKADDPRLCWSGIASLEQGPNWVKPWRIPHGDQDLYSPGVSELAGRAETASGVRLRFATDATECTLHTEPLAEDGNFDLYADGNLVATVNFVAGQTATPFADLPSGEKSRDLAVAGYARPRAGHRTTRGQQVGTE